MPPVARPQLGRPAPLSPAPGPLSREWRLARRDPVEGAVGEEHPVDPLSRMASSGFRSINLRCNPFGEPPFMERIDLAVARLIPVEPGTCVQVLAREGMGKTSLLLAQFHHRDDALYWRADRAGSAPRPSAGRALLLLDEADSLPRRKLARIIRPWPMVLAASHRDLSFATGRPTSTVTIGPWDARALRSVFERRMEWARFRAGPLPRIPEELIERLVSIHRGNLRAMEDDLYEWFQALKEAGGI